MNINRFTIHHPKTFENIGKIFLLGQVNGMVCNILHYLDSKTKFNGVNIGHFKCIGKFGFYVMQKKTHHHSQVWNHPHKALEGQNELKYI
jgi:hypothetical protein